MNKEICNYNSKGDCHGYQERYYNNGKLYIKGFCRNGYEIDYEEYYYLGCELIKTFYV